MKTDRRKSIGKTISNSVSEPPMLKPMRIWIYSLTKAYIPMITLLPLISSEKNNYPQKRHSIVISPKVIMLAA